MTTHRQLVLKKVEHLRRMAGCLSWSRAARAREVIGNTTRGVFGADAQVKLFGSRVDDAKRGGDIDLLVQLPRHQPDPHKKGLTLAARLLMQLGDQRIDVLVVDPQTPMQPIHREAVATGIPI